MNYYGAGMMDVAEAGIDEETMRALLEHLNETPSGGELLSGTVPDAPGADGTTTTTTTTAAATAAVTSGAFFSVLSGTHGKGEASATVLSSNDDEIPDYALPDAQYIERTMLPLLLRGLEEVALVRPPDPLAFLGAYMICNNPQKPPAPSSDGAGASGPGSGGEGDGAATWPAGSASLAEGAGAVPPPALAEVVQQAMARFSAGKGSGAGTSANAGNAAAGTGGTSKSA